MKESLNKSVLRYKMFMRRKTLLRCQPFSNSFIDTVQSKLKVLPFIFILLNNMTKIIGIAEGQ